MTELQHISGTPELYERLINRMELALETANTAFRLRNELLVELEIDGLSDDEIELIEAYLEKGAREAGGVVGKMSPYSLTATPEPSGALQAASVPAKVVWLKDARGAQSPRRSSRHSATTFRF